MSAINQIGQAGPVLYRIEENGGVSAPKTSVSRCNALELKVNAIFEKKELHFTTVGTSSTFDHSDKLKSTNPVRVAASNAFNKVQRMIQEIPSFSKLDWVKFRMDSEMVTLCLKEEEPFKMTLGELKGEIVAKKVQQGMIEDKVKKVLDKEIGGYFKEMKGAYRQMGLRI